MKFQCKKCKKSPDELWQVGDNVHFNNEDWYCEECFDKLQKKVYNKKKREQNNERTTSNSQQ